MICSESGKCVPDLSGGPGRTWTDLRQSSLPIVDTDTEKCGDIIPRPNEGLVITITISMVKAMANLSWDEEYRSFARQDLMILVKWAAATLPANRRLDRRKWLPPLDWATWAGNGAFGYCGGQSGTPTGYACDGYDIDIAYYQNGSRANPTTSEVVCDHEENGADQYHHQ